MQQSILDKIFGQPPLPPKKKKIVTLWIWFNKDSWKCLWVKIEAQFFEMFELWKSFMDWWSYWSYFLEREFNWREPNGPVGVSDQVDGMRVKNSKWKQIITEWLFTVLWFCERRRWNREFGTFCSLKAGRHGESFAFLLIHDSIFQNFKPDRVAGFPCTQFSYIN